MFLLRIVLMTLTLKCLRIWFNEHFRDIVARPQSDNPTFPAASRWRGTLGRKFMSHEEVSELINTVPRRKV